MQRACDCVEKTRDPRNHLFLVGLACNLLAGEPGADYERAFVTAAIESCETYRMRVAMDPRPGYYRSITPQRKAAITTFYEQAALRLYNGFAKRMANYVETGDPRQKRLAALFAEAQK